MNLLPKVQQEFAQTQYWDSFFKKRGKKTFEWYGDYLELCHQIHKYIKSKDKILIVGCGNSKLSMDLYDAGFKDIISIDVSSIAIKQMNELNKSVRPEMKFLEIDATDMKDFSDEEFSVVLDKGTLDALMPDNSDETKNTIIKYFKEIQRVLRNGGRYICISLLQEHILKFILDFLPNNNFLLRVIRCFENQECDTDETDHIAFPVFMIIATRFKILSQKILEVSLDGEKIQRVENEEEIFEAVTSIQKAALVCNGLSKGSIAGHAEVQIDLLRPGANAPRYTVFIIDQVPNQKNGKYAAFIVPQGREVEWLFSTPQGRKKLTQSAKYNRLAVVIMNRNHNFTTWDDVKTELSDCVRNLAPKGIKEQIPYLSLGSDVGERNIIANGSSPLSGSWIVEEVKIDNEWYRRLIFQNNQFVVQSEVRVIKKEEKKGKAEDKKIDTGYLACQHHRYMVIGVHCATMENSNNEGDVLVIGLGGGALCTYLYEVFKNQKITAVEIDKMMLYIAENHFDLKEDERLKIVIADGIDYLINQSNEGKKFDVIMFDVDSKDLSLGMSCPPKSFLELNILNAIKLLLNENGLFVLNLVCRDDNLRNEVINNLKQHFILCSYKLDEDLNEIVYLQCKMDNHNSEKIINQENNLKSKLELSIKNINKQIKDQNIAKDDLIDEIEFLNGLKI